MTEAKNTATMLKPVGWRILVEEYKQEQVTAGGIIISDDIANVQQTLNFVGKVVAVGDGAYRHPKFAVIDDDGKKALPEPWVKPGQYILFGVYTGMVFEQNSRETRLRFVNDDDILAVTDNPADFKVYL